MTRQQLRREIRFTRAWAISSTTLLLIVTAAGFARGSRVEFDEITAHRVNIVEPDGTVRLVLAGKARTPARVMRGRTFGADGDRPYAGLVFYNDEGTETGGLIYGGASSPDGGYGHGLSLTFDQFNQDQVLALQHFDENGQRQHGMTLLDRPGVPLDSMIDLQQAIRNMGEGPARDSAQRAFVKMQGLPGNNSWAVPRMYVGRDASRAAAVRLHDPAGRVRIRMEVDSSGMPRLEFLDSTGVVVDRLPR